MHPQVLGLDIGGANLKAAHTNGLARLVTFELWKHPGRLSEVLGNLLKSWPPYDLLAVTMTGELCDCFETRAEGVCAILGALTSVANSIPIRIWRNDGSFVSPSDAGRSPLASASANWLALATCAGRFIREGSALLIDIGSTTTDIVPIYQGSPRPQGRTDAERLRSGELVYTGVRRTPICAVVGSEVAAELFATTLDVYLVLGKISEDEENHFTADGRPASKRAAHARLARMLGADHDTCPVEDTLALARRAEACQMRILRNAVAKVAATLPSSPRAVILSGSGEFLVRPLLESMDLAQVSLAEKMGQSVSESACAFAVAILAAETIAA
jgi:(4-(4-[2-(gamma-L-glutamylamino)ethyl]phenoxymethyl)furan-2-yl)methanamine synthase